MPDIEEKKPAVIYAIHNASRSRHTRLARSQRATHQGLKQHILGDQFRLLRGRPVFITEEKLLAHLEELREGVASGLIEVKTGDGRPVDLTTMTAPETVVTPLLPHPLLDSAANDKPGGQEKMPLFPGGVSQTDVETIPGGIPRAGDPVEEDDAPPVDETEETPEPTAADFTIPAATPTVEDPVEGEEESTEEETDEGEEEESAEEEPAAEGEKNEPVSAPKASRGSSRRGKRGK